MATVEELLRAAKNADAAGDTDAARALVQAANAMMPAPKAVDGPQEPPRAYGDNGMAAEPTAAQPDRFGDTIADAVAGPWEGAKMFGRGLLDQSQSPTMQALPEGMPGALKAPIAAVGDLGGAALTTLGTAYAGGAGLIGEIFGGSPTNERKLASDMMMMGEVAVPELAGVSSTTRMAARAANAADDLAIPATDRQAAARAAGDLGITPSLGMGGKVRGMTAAALEKTPVAGDLIAKDAARAVGEVEGVFSTIRSKIGAALSPAGAGEALQSGLEGFVKGFKKTSGKLYDVVDKRIPKDARFALDATASRIAGAKAAFEGNPELAKKLGLEKWDAIISEAQDPIVSGGVTLPPRGIGWDALKQFRSDVGEAIGNMQSGKQGGSLSSDDLSRLKSLYGALTLDMEAAAKSAGSSAYSAWKRANGHYKAGAERIERSLDATIKPDAPERAFEAFTALLQKDRASADITRVRQIKASLGKDDWNTISASIVERLGKAPAGQQTAAGDRFSPAVFLTNWNKMDAEAKRLLIPEEAREELEKLARVAQTVKESNLERNASNTGTVVAATALASGLTTVPITTILTASGTYLSVKGMTSPAFLRALNKAARGDVKQLEAMAKGNGPFKADATTVLRMTAAEASQGDAANSTTAPRAAANR